MKLQLQRHTWTTSQCGETSTSPHLANAHRDGSAISPRPLGLPRPEAHSNQQGGGVLLNTLIQSLSVNSYIAACPLVTTNGSGILSASMAVSATCSKQPTFILRQTSCRPISPTPQVKTKSSQRTTGPCQSRVSLARVAYAKAGAIRSISVN